MVGCASKSKDPCAAVVVEPLIPEEEEEEEEEEERQRCKEKEGELWLVPSFFQ